MKLKTYFWGGVGGGGAFKQVVFRITQMVHDFFRDKDQFIIS